jgi:anti-sigma factor RsiW
MDCQQSQDLMSAAQDAELNPADQCRLLTHLDECADCRAALADIEALHGRIAAQATVYTAPPHLRHRVQTALRTEASQRPARRFAASWPWAWINLGLATAATTAFAVTLALYLSQPSGNELAERELVASHFRALMPDHLADVVSTDQHTVKPWFAGKLDFSPPVYDLAPQGYTLVGGRLDYLQQRPVAALAYRHRQHIMNLYVWPTPSQRDQAPHASERQGFHLLRWSQGGMAFSAVSDMNPQDLADFAHQFQDQVTRSAAQ